FFGAILLTGYVGGTIIAHLRVGEPVYMNVIIGFLIWVGLYLRRPRLRELVWSSRPPTTTLAPRRIDWSRGNRRSPNLPSRAAPPLRIDRAGPAFSAQFGLQLSAAPSDGAKSANAAPASTVSAIGAARDSVHLGGPPA